MRPVTGRAASDPLRTFALREYQGAMCMIVKHNAVEKPE